ncbi:MAG: cytidine deaminase [Proteobacteria bacterium]|nr:cytidine deaminase [Pseudomonadota bacterium]
MVDECTLKRLEAAARNALENAYCRYSRFPVGAAVLTEDGEVFAGCNVENASYGLTICAERNAIFQAVAAGHRKIKAVVVVTSSSTPTPPCGACRQVINEFGTSTDIVSVDSTGNSSQYKIEELLPNSFRPSDLK